MEVGGSQTSGALEGSTMNSVGGNRKLLAWFPSLVLNSFRYTDNDEEPMQTTPRRRSSRVAKAQDTSKDVANCFGFDDDDDDDDDK